MAKESDATQDQLMRCAEAARFLGISRQAVQIAIAADRLPCVRVAGMPFVTRAAVICYDENRRRGSRKRGALRATHCNRAPNIERQ